MSKTYFSFANLSPITYYALLIGVSTLVFFLYIWVAQNLDHFESLRPIVDGTAARPYVYRVLTSLAIRALHRIASISYEISGLIVLYTSLLGFILLFSRLSNNLLSPESAKIATIFAPFELVPFLLVQRHIYDLATLFLFCLSFVFLYENNFGAYLISFTLACLSKETALLFIPFFAIHFRKLPKLYYFTLLTVQGVIYAAIRLAVMWQFRNNPGSIIELHFRDQISAYPAHPIQTIIFALFIFSLIALVVYRWKEKPAFLREATLSMAVPILVLYIFFGMPYELRVFLEVYPILYLLAFFAFRLPENRLMQAEYNKH